MSKSGYIEPYFDKRTYKVLRAIYKSKGGLTLQKIDKICAYNRQTNEHIEDMSITIIQLLQNGYIGGKDINGKFIAFDDGNYVTSSDDTYYCLGKGCCFVEDRILNRTKWLIPLVFSAISLLISALTLLLKLIEII